MRGVLALMCSFALAAAACSGNSEPTTTAGVSVPITAASGAEATTTSIMAPLTTDAPSPPPTEAPPPPEPPSPRIGIRDGSDGQEFYMIESGERFYPRGTNLVFWRGGAILDTPISPEVWDKDWVRDRMVELSDLGYNTIRVMWDLCENCAAESAERLKPDLLDNAVSLLEIAADQGIYVWYTSNDLPADSWYSRRAFEDGEADFLTERNVEVYREYYTDFVGGLVERGARTDWLFALDIRNEYVYQLDWLPPWTLTEGFFEAANGEIYDLAVEAERHRLSSEGIRYWADEMTAVVKSFLPEALVTMTTLTPNDRVMERGVDDPRWVIVDDFFDASDIDFLNIHGLALDPDELLWEYVMDDTAKPVVTGEFGLGFGFGSVDVAAFWMTYWQAESCAAGFDGWLTWHWMGDDGRWPGYTPIVADSLSPALHPDPCERVVVEVVYRSFNSTVTASATEPSGIDEFLPENVVDQNVDTWWSAGAGVPQWLLVDLGGPGKVGRIEMPIGFLTPSGQAVIETWGINADGSTEVLLHTFKETIAPGDVLEASFEPVDGIQFVRFDFVQMRDWVIIHDVGVWAE